MTENIFKLTAEKFGVTEEEVRSEIQKAIAEAGKSSRTLADKLSSEEEIPTPEEVIAYIISQIDKNRQN